MEELLRNYGKILGLVDYMQHRYTGVRLSNTFFLNMEQRDLTKSYEKLLQIGNTLIKNYSVGELEEKLEDLKNSITDLPKSITERDATIILNGYYTIKNDLYGKVE